MSAVPLESGTQVHVLPWDQFSEMFRRDHKPGEHIAAVGPTGSGKSVLLLSLCKLIGSRTAKDRRPARVVVMATKPRDDTIRTILPESGWPIIKKWPPSYGQEHCIVWPRKGAPSAIARIQRRTFGPLLDVIFQEGGQTVCIDEAGYFEDPLPDGLGLSTTMKQYWTVARANTITMVAGTQRPRHVTLSMWTEPSWVIVFTPEDEQDLKRVAELSGAKDAVMEIVPQLGGHEFLCIRRQRGREKALYVSKVM